MTDSPSKRDPADDDSSSSEYLEESFGAMKVTTDENVGDEKITDAEAKFLSRMEKVVKNRELEPVDNLRAIVSLQKGPKCSALKSSGSPQKGLKRSALKSSGLPRKGPKRSALKSSGSSRPNLRREVSFKDVVVRDYSMTLGDNPSCSYGPPVCLGWEYEDMGALNLEEYEACRGKRRGMRQMVLSYYRRVEILEGAGHSKNEIQSVTRQVNKLKRQRDTTKFFAPVMGVEMVVRSAGRKAKRAFDGPKKE